MCCIIFLVYATRPSVTTGNTDGDVIASAAATDRDELEQAGTLESVSHPDFHTDQPSLSHARLTLGPYTCEQQHMS